MLLVWLASEISGLLLLEGPGDELLPWHCSFNRMEGKQGIGKDRERHPGEQVSHTRHKPHPQRTCHLCKDESRTDIASQEETIVNHYSAEDWWEMKCVDVGSCGVQKLGGGFHKDSDQEGQGDLKRGSRREREHSQQRYYGWARGHRKCMMCMKALRGRLARGGAEPVCHRDTQVAACGVGGQAARGGALA